MGAVFLNQKSKIKKAVPERVPFFLSPKKAVGRVWFLGDSLNWPYGAVLVTALGGSMTMGRGF